MCLSKQQAKQTVAAGEIADACLRVLVHTCGDQALEVYPGAVKDTNGRILRIDKPRRSIYGLLQDVLQ